MVADASGQVIERMAKSWQAHAQGIAFEVVTTDKVSLVECCRRGQAAGQVWWFDTRRAFHAMKVACSPQVVVVHHHLPGEEQRVLQLARNCDAVVAVSRVWQERLQKLTAGPVWLGSLSTDTTWFHPQGNRAQLRAQMGISPETFVIGFVAKAGANVGDRKGVELLRQVLMRLRLPRPWMLWIVGPGWEAFAQDLRAQGMHVIHETFPDCRATVRAYQYMDVMLVTAREEGGPATLFEAMACGVPVIASPVGHVPEVIHDGQTGMLCQSGDVAGFVRALERLSNTRELQRALAEAGRTLVVAEREDAKVIPRIDVRGMHAAAQERFARRTTQELRGRQWRLRWLKLRAKLILFSGAKNV